MKQDSHNTYIRVGTTLYKQVKKPPLLFSLAGKKRNTITNPYREKVGRLCEASHVSVRRKRLLRRTDHFVYTHINIATYGKAD